MIEWVIVILGIVLIVVAVRSFVRDRSVSIPEQRLSAYEEAELVRDGVLTRDQALERIAIRYPQLSRSQANDLLARGLFESR
jgi:hypothetical protein